MKTIFRLFVLVLLLGGWGLAALSLHVVRVPGEQQKIALIPKNSLGIFYTYVDMRKWTVDDLARNAPVVQRMLDVGKADLLASVVNGDKGADVKARVQSAIEGRADGKSDSHKNAKTAAATRSLDDRAVAAWWELWR